MQLQFYRDDAGDPRVRCEGPGEAVAGFLESDLQGSVESAREVLRALDAVESGEIPDWDRTGNAYTLTLTPEEATFWNEMDEDAEPYALSLAEARRAVADWVAFLEG